MGSRDAARAMADSMVRYAASAYFNAYGIAAVFGEFGDADNAFLWLDCAVEQRTMWLTLTGHDRALASLHADPRWPALMRRLRQNQ